MKRGFSKLSILKRGRTTEFLKVPAYVVKDLLRDRLSLSEINRINRFAENVESPQSFRPGSVVVDFSKKTAHCFQAGMVIRDLEPTGDVTVEQITLDNY